MQWLARLDRSGRLSFAAAQESGVRERFGLSRADTDASAWAIDTQGHRYAGAEAVIAALSSALGWPVLLWLYRLVLWHPLANAAYRWVARHRRSLPGVQPYCAGSPTCAD